MRRVSATELAGMGKCERQAELKVRRGGERHSAEALRLMERGTQEHKCFEKEDLGGSRCFVASWACGESAPETEFLRGWRDRALLPSRPGRALVRLYYWVSPKLIRALAPLPGAKALSKALVRLIARVLGGGHV